MNKTRFTKFLSFVMAMIIVVAIMPVTAVSAATGTENVIFFATDRHEETSKLQSLLKALAYTPGLVVLGGDHVNNTNSGSLASITSEIQSVYPGVQTFYTYAAHDPNVSEDSSNPYAFARTGEVYEGADYYVYGVDQDDMQSSSSASSATTAFKTWAASADSSKVIFVMCHMPIHNRRGDNAGGATWMSALNEVGQSHDIVYLWGHNHTGENSTDTSVYFVSVGGSLTPQGGSTGTINFTYMNAGYIKNGYASMVVVNSDCVDVTRYSTSGSATATYEIERRFAQTHTWEVTEQVDATCEEDGYQTVVCADCGETKTTVISATGHDYSTEVMDTCTGSFTVYTCGVCGHSYSQQNPTETTYDSVSSLVDGESYVIVASNYALTYGSSAGRTSVTASNGSITSNVTDAMIWTYENGMLSNSSSGTTYYINVSSSSGSNRPGSSSSRTITFSTSGASVSYSSSKLKIGSYYLYHSSSSGFSARSSGSTVTLYQVNEVMGSAGEHVYQTVTVDPTCTTNGSVTYTCTQCGYSYSEVIEANGSHNYTATTVEATCGTAGSVTYTCETCGDTYTEEIAALGHTYNAVVTAPTCTEDGYTTYTCGTCGDSYTANEVAAPGHSYEVVTEKATCTEGGTVTYTCACGESYTETLPALGHNYTSAVTAPTCETAGYTTYTCEVCGDSYVTNETAALGHNYTSVVTAPTCTKDGCTTYTCEVCGDSYIADEVSALGHNYTSAVTAPTCTEGGYTTYTCATCGDSYVADEVSALGHNATSVVTAPTCTEGGYTTNTCAICGDTYISDEVAALGHSYKTETVAATCTEDGSVTYTCGTCGDTYTEVIAALGHDYAAVVIVPTCTEGGYTTNTCVVCGDTNISNEVAALGHSYEAETMAATCTENGSVTYTCACGDTYTEVIAALGHNYASKVTVPTCETAGCTTHTCGICGDSYVTDEIAALGHSYETVTTAPTCETDGYTTYTCGACGDSYTAEVVAALGHSYSFVVTAPTCTEGGYTTYTCATCGYSYVSDVSEALGHSHEAVVTAPTCETAGYTTYTCVCGDTYVADETAALGHNYTCEEVEDFLIYTCENCGSSYSEKVVTEITYDKSASFTNGKQYVITIYSGSKYYALCHVDGELTAVQISANGQVSSEVTEDMLWTYQDGKLFYEENGTTYYLYASGSGWMSWFGSATLQLSTTNSSTCSISSNKLKIGSYYLRYSWGGFGLNRSAGTAYIYAKNET